MIVTGDAEPAEAGTPRLPGAKELSQKVELALQALQTSRPLALAAHLHPPIITYPTTAAHTLAPPAHPIYHSSTLRTCAAGAAPYAASPPPLVAHVVSLQGARRAPIGKLRAGGAEGGEGDDGCDCK